MADEIGGWRRHTEGRCRKRSITTGLNAEEYCKRCWGEKVWGSIEEERRRETEEWICEGEEERLQEEGPQPPPTLEEEVAALRERVTKLENVLGYGEIVWRSESGHRKHHWDDRGRIAALIIGYSRGLLNPRVRKRRVKGLSDLSTTLVLQEPSL